MTDRATLLGIFRWTLTMGAVLFVALAALEVVSPRTWGSRTGTEVALSHGELGIVWGNRPASVGGGWRRVASTNVRDWGWAPRIQVTAPPNWIVVPIWIPLVACCAPLPWLWWPRRRGADGCCGQCGYDLQKLRLRPDPTRRFGWAIVCPECGGVTPGPPQSER